MSVPRYELATVDRGPSALLWGGKSTWDKNVSPLNGSVAKDDFSPFQNIASETTASYPGLIRNSTTTDFAPTTLDHGVLRIDYNTTAGDNTIFGAAVNKSYNLLTIDEAIAEFNLTLNQDNELVADGGTVDFIGLSSATDPTNSSDGVSAGTTAAADTHFGVRISAAGVCDLIAKPNESTAAAVVVKAAFATITKGPNVFHKVGVKVARLGNGGYLVNACVDNVLAAQAGIKVAASALVATPSSGSTIVRPVISSRTPGGASGQVPASNLDWYECLDDRAVYNIQA